MKTRSVKMQRYGGAETCRNMRKRAETCENVQKHAKTCDVAEVISKIRSRAKSSIQ